ncbi:MAG: manganese efflux pump MntP family protein [Bacteroidales bacterium]
MNAFEIILLAIGLSMDTFAVSLSAGLALKPFRLLYIFRIAVWLALFQGIMPVIGWFLGREFIFYIENCDHWIAFTLLLFLGIKMIYEALFSKDNNKSFAPTQFITLAQLGIATSIDALAVGVSFAFLRINMWQAITIITLVTFLISVAGCYIGKIFGTKWNKCSSLAGGVILIAIGIKILIEHTCC